MKILQICSARSIGGGERHVADLSNALKKRGHEVFAAVVPGSPMVGDLSELPADNIATFPLRNSLDIASGVKIGRFSRDNGIELINAHLAKDYPAAAIAARVANIPFVITRHVLFPMSGVHSVILRNARFVIAPSDAVANNLQGEAIFPADKIVTIRYGLDVDRFPMRDPVKRDEIIIGAIGNLDPVKGFDVLIRAAVIVTKDHAGVKFVIVGEDRSGDNRNQVELEKLIAELGLEGTVELAGWSPDVRGRMAEFDIFVSASRSESFGFVIAEAMLSGVPVIASETAGAREIISDPSLGRLVPIDDPEALANAIIEQMEGTSIRTEDARRHIVENFSLQRMLDETEALYRRVLS